MEPIIVKRLVLSDWLFADDNFYAVNEILSFSRRDYRGKPVIWIELGNVYEPTIIAQVFDDNPTRDAAYAQFFYSTWTDSGIVLMG